MHFKLVAFLRLKFNFKCWNYICNHKSYKKSLFKSQRQKSKVDTVSYTTCLKVVKISRLLDDLNQAVINFQSANMPRKVSSKKKKPKILQVLTLKASPLTSVF